ncbi:exo-alpha-sialidase [Candidatus Sumerlaeota bacterium]|nr:exo-alpha-sialidase [Candidatus Sumerlaeota bacterium]
MRTSIALLFALLVCSQSGAAELSSGEGELIFPLEHWHNHGSCIVECPNGDLLVCWFHGSGERNSDDVLIMGARKVKLTGEWTEPFLMADTPDFPDTNSCMIIDPQSRLWLLWPTIQANTWESALMKYKISTDYQMPEGPPIWEIEKVLHMKPGDEFEAIVRAKTEQYLAGREVTERSRRWAERNFEQAADKLTRRIGWFTRAHPYFLDQERMLVGLYSDGFSFSIVTYTDDGGETWKMSEPIVGGGNIQPSFARKNDGTIVAYMRDNGPAPKKVHVSESRDRGVSWSEVVDHAQLNNPGSGLEVMNLASGRWLVAYNDRVRGRHSLAVSLSDDQGETYPWTRHLELVPAGQGSFAYPSIMQARDGSIHVTYSYSLPPAADGGGERKSIKHVRFDEAWILAGDPEGSAPAQ